MARMAARSYRFDADTMALMRLLVREMGVTETDVLRLAVRSLAKQHGVEIPKQAAGGQGSDDNV
jgi:hypothetical protein